MNNVKWEEVPFVDRLMIIKYAQQHIQEQLDSKHLQPEMRTRLEARLEWTEKLGYDLGHDLGNK